MINKFREEYLFLSNFYQGKTFYYKGMPFDNSEAAFHSQKDLNRQYEFIMMNPSQSKKLGRQVDLRNDWEQIKDKIMYDVLYEKFTQDENLKRKLLSTSGHDLVEGNYHHDNYWGDCYCDRCRRRTGKNHLGILLMRLREELIKELQ